MGLTSGSCQEKERGPQPVAPDCSSVGIAKRSALKTGPRGSQIGPPQLYVLEFLFLPVCRARVPEIVVKPPPPCAPMDDQAERRQAEVQQAMEILDRVFRRRKAQREFAAVVKRARAQFLHAEALAAGAEHGEFYSKAALLVRHRLRHNALVLSALRRAWKFVLAASRSSAAPAVGGEHAPLSWRRVPTLQFHAYSVMYRKLYLVMKERQGSWSIDPDDCLSTIEAEWRQDCDGLAELTQAGFYKSWFELCDLHVPSVDEEDYSKWIEMTLRQLTCYGGKAHDLAPTGIVNYRLVRWRPDWQLLTAVCRCVQLRTAHKWRGAPDAVKAARLGGARSSPSAQRQQIFRLSREQWEAIFGSQDAEEQNYASLRLQPPSVIATTAKLYRSAPPRLQSNSAGRLERLRQPTASMLLGQGPSHRGAPVLAFRAPTLPHRQAPALPTRVMTGNGWVCVAGASGSVIGARRAVTAVQR